VRRVGVLMSVEDDAEGEARFSAFQHALQDLGWAPALPGNHLAQLRFPY
jgi:hypothetical protein